MRDWFQALASLKLAIGLLVLVVIALAAGTLIESARGTEAAARTVYYSPWFRVLLGLFALNVICSLINLWPWGWQRAGFALTHGSMLLILAGALVTDQLKVEGRLGLWEGEESARFVQASGPAGTGEMSFRELPFRVRLESFEIDTYPGTERPAMFRSRVVVTEPDTGNSFPAIIEMNRELSHRGYRLFQSSYQRTPERDQTILSVSKDPGQPIVFIGYILLMAGMITVLGTRIQQRRLAERLAGSRPLKVVRRVAVVGMGLALCLAASILEVDAATVPDPVTVEQLRRMPVQHDGRVMPLDTLAREAAWKVTGSTEWRGTDPVALVLGWALYPEEWAAESIVRVVPSALGVALGLPAGAKHASFMELARSQRLMEMAGQARAAQQGKRPVHPLLEKAQNVEERLRWVQGFLNREILRVVPPADESADAWSAPAELRGASTLIGILQKNESDGLAARKTLGRELTYNQVRPSRLSWWILGVATLTSLLAWRFGRRWIDVLAVAGLLAGFGVMSWGIWVRWQIAGRIPASNMYESLLFLGWGVALFALVALVFLRNRLVIFNATAMAALTMMLADVLPIDPFIHPVPPVLAGTVWLAIHVPIIMVSYSVLALGVLIAHMQIGLEIFAPARRDLVAKMNDLLYWYIQIGSILLIAGILTGSIWAASSWGRYWGWDPKEVWSLIAFLVYLAILHGRMDKVLGSFGVAAVSIVAFWTILMTYVGVNYVLASGLHSYGFGGSGVVRWMLVAGAVETLFLGTGLLVQLSKRTPQRQVAA